MWDGGLPCAIMGHPITHSKTNSSEWVTNTHTSHLCSHVSFLFPTQAELFLSRQHLHHRSIPFTLLCHNIEPRRQRCDHKNTGCFSSVFPPLSWSRDLDGMSHKQADYPTMCTGWVSSTTSPCKGSLDGHASVCRALQGFVYISANSRVQQPLLHYIHIM